LLRPFDLSSSEIQVTQDYIFLSNFFLAKLVDARASSESTWRRSCASSNSIF